MEIIWRIGATVLFLLAAMMLVLRWAAMSGAPLPEPLATPLPERKGRSIGREELWKVFALAVLLRVTIAI